MGIIPTSTWELIELDDHHAKGTRGNMLFMVWGRETQLSSWEKAFTIVHRLAMAYPAGVGVMQTVELGATPPDTEVRKSFTEFHKLEKIAHLSVTHEAPGFKAASVRAILQGAQMMARPPFPHSVHSSLNAAAAWHAKCQRSIGVDMPASTMLEVIQSMRRDYYARTGLTPPDQTV